MAARDLHAAPPNISQLEAHDFDIEAARAEQFGEKDGEANKKLSEKADEATSKALDEQQEKREAEKDDNPPLDERAPEKSTPATRKAQTDDKK